MKSIQRRSNRDIWGKINDASWIIAMFALGVIFGVLFWIGGQVSAAPMGDMENYERIPFTNKPVIAGNPESYIGTYGQCPFYENAMEKGCYPPSDIECNADWSYCQPRTASVAQPQMTNDTNTASTPQNVATPPKSTNSGYSGAGSSTSYAPNVANESTDVNQTAETAPIANDDVETIAGIPADNVERIKVDRHDYTTEFFMGIGAIAIIVGGIWYWRKKPFNK